MESVFGGSSNEQSSSSESGFGLLPTEIQEAFKKLATQSQKYIGDTGSSIYTPIDLTSGEQTAISNINKGFTPTQQTIESDIAMQTNPFDSYVIDAINREAQGENSTLNQALNTAGQFGSNRAVLGANDIDLTRLQKIGEFKQNQYNTALNNSLNTLTQQRVDDASKQLGAGTYQRDLSLAQSTAPITALQEIAKAMGILPTTGGSTSTSSGSSSSSNGIVPSIFG